MKNFNFPLQRVLAWRRTQLRVEQAKLERLIQEIHSIDTQAGAVRRELEDSRNTLIRAQSKLGVELNVLEDYRNASEAQCAALEQSRKACLERATAQRAVIQLKERDVKLLEKLREDRFRVWRTAQEKEIDRQAEESFLARWARDGK